MCFFFHSSRTLNHRRLLKIVIVIVPSSLTFHYSFSSSSSSSFFSLLCSSLNSFLMMIFLSVRSFTTHWFDAFTLTTYQTQFRTKERKNYRNDVKTPDEIRKAEIKKLKIEPDKKKVIKQTSMHGKQRKKKINNFFFSFFVFVWNWGLGTGNSEFEEKWKRNRLK